MNTETEREREREREIFAMILNFLCLISFNHFAS